MADRVGSLVVVHADESCLGNGMEGDNPGGAASLVETLIGEDIVRHDLYISAHATTNNRMALAGAIAAFALLSEQRSQLKLVYVSDSQYLVKGITEWVPGWRARGWKRKGGAVENLELWKRLVKVSTGHDATWKWVRGHAGHAKNEYVNDLAILAATEQRTSEGLVESGLEQWLDRERSRGKYTDYDPDRAARELEAELP